MRPASSTTPALLAMTLISGVGLAQTTIEWAAPVDGEFGIAANWSPPVVPGPLDTVVLGGVGAYIVSVDTRQFGLLNVPNPEAMLRVMPESFVSITGYAGEGTVVVGDSFSPRSASLRILGGGTIDGEIRLDGSESFRAKVVGGGVLGPRARVSGQGRVENDWVGPGLFFMDEPGRLNVEGSYDGATFCPSGGGAIDLSWATFENCTFELMPDGFYNSRSTIVRDSVFVDPFVMTPVPAGSSLIVQGGVEFEQGVRIEGGTVVFTPEAEFNSTMRFVRGTLLADPSSVLGPDALLTGPFTLEGDWIGRGTVAIDEEGVLRIDGALTGATVRASAGGTVECFGTITGGTIIAGDGGAFVTGLNTTYEHSTIRGEYVVDIDRDLTLGAGSTIEDRLVIRGAPTGDGRVDVADAAAIEGLIVLDAVTSHQASLRAIGSSATLAQGSRIAGQGALWGPWLVHGTLDPGFGGVAGLGDAVGLLQPAVESRLTLSPSARLHIDIAGRAPGSFDRLATTSADASVVLGGILRVRFADGYAPDATDRYEIVRATVVDGAFATIDVEPAGSTASVGPAHVVYTGDAAVLVLCAADRDGDGELTIFDFLEYQNQFDARDPQADLDGDGRLTLFDFLAFQNGFDAGCG